jgi:hypothetical protein
VPCWPPRPPLGHRRTTRSAATHFLWAIALNSAGTPALAGGSLLAIIRRRNSSQARSSHLGHN